MSCIERKRFQENGEKTNNPGLGYESFLEIPE
jgi:hypothetical protein